VLVETAINGSKTLVIVFALAFGIAAPKLLVYYKKHQVG
jgi:hypothetical protein